MTKRRRTEAGTGNRGKAAAAPLRAAPAAHGQARRAREAENRRSRRWRTIRIWAALGGVGTAAILFVLWQSGALIPHLGRELPSEGGVGVHLAEGESLPQRGDPPASGPHYASRASYGASSVPIEPGAWLHALEHGGVAVLYRCGPAEECSSIAGQLETDVYTRARAGKFGERKLVITPYPDLATPYAALAWGRILELETLDTMRILAFYDRYLDRGPESAR